MSSFPTLRTGAVLQYGSGYELRFETRVLRFVDGSEQRFRLRGKGGRRWLIRLEMLDEGELAALENFAAAMQGSNQEFEFTDPWDGLLYSRCRLQNDALELVQAGPHRGLAQLEIIEVTD